MNFPLGVRVCLPETNLFPSEAVLTGPTTALPSLATTACQPFRFPPHCLPAIPLSPSLPASHSAFLLTACQPFRFPPHCLPAIPLSSSLPASHSAFLLTACQPFRFPPHHHIPLSSSPFFISTFLSPPQHSSPPLAYPPIPLSSGRTWRGAEADGPRPTVRPSPKVGPHGMPASSSRAARAERCNVHHVSHRKPGRCPTSTVRCCEECRPGLVAVVAGVCGARHTCWLASWRTGLLMSQFWRYWRAHGMCG